MPKERRRTPRHQLGRVAAILCGPGEERSCLVKDFSDGGVRLQLNGFEIPDDFALVFAPNEIPQSGRYKVVWRLGNDVGANPRPYDLIFILALQAPSRPHRCYVSRSYDWRSPAAIASALIPASSALFAEMMATLPAGFGVDVSHPTPQRARWGHIRSW